MRPAKGEMCVQNKETQTQPVVWIHVEVQRKNQEDGNMLTSARLAAMETKKAAQHAKDGHPIELIRPKNIRSMPLSKYTKERKSFMGCEG